MTDRGGPYIEVRAKRTFDNVPLQVDWHDYLARLWSPGTAFAAGVRIRRPRAYSTGLQYSSSGGVSGRREPNWPKTAGGTVVDGDITWTAEAMSSSSLRTTISSDDWPAVTGLTLAGEQNGDLVYQVNADGGTSGQSYEVKHQVTLANGEEKEALIVLPVRD